jgi:hypothetical protein
MNRSDHVLAGLATAGTEPWSPVQVQKLFFLVDQRLESHLGGRAFQFEPYDYGPFDPAVYHEINELADHGLATVSRPAFERRTYALTEPGRARGEAILENQSEVVRTSIRALAAWVRALSFKQLVTAIYAEFPDMKARSVFRGE